MINKNSSGGNLSANYATSVAESTRKFTARIMMGGNELSCAIQRLTFTKGSCGTTEGFSIGNIISSTVTATLKEVSTSLKGQVIDVQIGLWTGSDYEYVTMGSYIASEVDVTAYTTTVVAYGFSTSRMGGTFTLPNTFTIANIVSAIETATSVDIVLPTVLDTSLELNKPLPTGCSCYQALQIIASVIGGYVTDTYDGKVEIKYFSDTTTVSVTTDRMLRLPVVGEVPFEITGVKVLVSEASEDAEGTPIPEVSYTYGTPVVLYDTNEYMSALLFDVYKMLVGYEYRNGEIDLSLGDPRIEGSDVLSVTDVDGSTYVVPCHSVTHTYDGGFSTQITASKPTTQDEGIATLPPISQRIDVIANATSQALASAEIALESARIAKTASEMAQASAESAGESASQAQQSADEAMLSAYNANIQANYAYTSASTAQMQLSEIENVLGALNWIAEHGKYGLTENTEVIDGKWYFSAVFTLTTDTALNPTKTYYELDNGVYVVVENPDVQYINTYYEGTFAVEMSPTGDPNAQGFYELISVDDAISNYIQTHLALTDDGLYVQMDDTASKLQISADGITLWGFINGNPTALAQFKSDVTIGDENSTHVVLSSGELGFYDSQTKVAYISGNQLFISKAEITNELRIGKFIWVVQNTNRISLRYSP